MKFHITAIRPPGFLHTSGFAEIIDSLSWSLAELGHQVVIAENAFSPDGTNIVFGAELLSKDQQFPENVILYNLEQKSHPNFPLTLGKKAVQVWDYAASNIPIWLESGISAVHVPFGFTPNLCRIPKVKDKTTDVFFSGFLTERRIKLIEQLRRAGLSVVALDNTYGGARDQHISRAKVCVNVRHDGRTYFNPQRVSFWLANSKCVASEFSEDDKDYKYLDHAIVRFSMENAVPMIASLVRNEKWIHDMEIAGYAAFHANNYTDTVAAALKQLPQPNPVVAKYEQGCKGGDMMEYLPFLRANSRGDCLEIGVRDGISTSAILLGLEKNGGELYSVDVNANCAKLFDHPQWHFYQSDSKTLKVEENYFDLALVDGDHSELGVSTDLNNCFRWVKNGGVILVHDTTAQKTYEEFGGDWPSVAVGQVYKKFYTEKSLTHLDLPGVQGMGVIVVKK